MSVALWANARDCPETPKTNGYRHLLEHLMARGPKRDIDTKLETLGGYLTAKTLRETMQFSMTVPKGSMSVALSTVFDLMSPPALTVEQIQTEAKIIREELALQDPSRYWSSLAWGHRGSPDPGGDFEVMSAATPDQLRDTYRRQFAAQNLVLAVAGDFPVEEMSRAAEKIMGVMPRRESKPMLGDPVSEPKLVSQPGVAFAVDVKSFDTVQTAHVLAAALALGSETTHNFVYYTPSNLHSLVILGTTDEADVLRRAIVKAIPQNLFTRSKRLVEDWVKSQIKTPEQIVDFRGMLLCLHTDLTPDALLDSARSMTYAEFVKAIARFQDPKAEVRR